jgi:hypothetical protein
MHTEFLLEGLKRRGQDNIKVDLKEMVQECGLDSYGPGKGPVAGWCVHSKEPLGSIKLRNFLTTCMTVSFSRRALLRGPSCSQQ